RQLREDAEVRARVPRLGNHPLVQREVRVEITEMRPHLGEPDTKPLFWHARDQYVRFGEGGDARHAHDCEHLSRAWIGALRTSPVRSATETNQRPPWG